MNRTQTAFALGALTASLILPYTPTHAQATSTRTKVTKTRAHESDTYLYAPTDGEVIRKAVNVGRVTPHKPLVIPEATGASTALLPPDNATGNFTKVVQRIPDHFRNKQHLRIYYRRTPHRRHHHRQSQQHAIYVKHL